MTVKIGLIGAGRIGKIHAESIVNRIPDAELVAVSDVSREAAEWVGRTFRSTIWSGKQYVSFTNSMTTTNCTRR